MGAKPSKAAQDAELYFMLYPQTSVPAIAAKFGLNESTIYRAAWYKNRKRAQPKTGEK